MLHLSVMQNFTSIGNHLRIGINKKNHSYSVSPLNRAGDNYQAGIHVPIPL